jgi:ribose transport system substrate-binding protein
VAAADAALGERGTYHDVAPSPRPAVRGKHVVVISAGQADSGDMARAEAVMAAAKAIGWQAELYDAKLDPANDAPLVRQAVAARADGIIAVGIDCDRAEQAFQEAKAANIAVVGTGAVDCSDPHGGNEPTGLFSASIDYGAHGGDVDAFAQEYGASMADYVIAASHDTAKVIDVSEPDIATQSWVFKGFDDTLAASAGSRVVATVTVTASDVLAGNVEGEVRAALQSHPGATWVKSPSAWLSAVAIAPAVAGAAAPVQVMGADGAGPELDLVRRGAVAAVGAISPEWEGWAAVDTMNSVFRHQQPVDSGIGWQLADRAHLPAASPLVPTVAFMSEYLRAWGLR